MVLRTTNRPPGDTGSPVSGNRTNGTQKSQRTTRSLAANMPDERSSVLRVLDKMHATSRNLLFASQDTADLQAAFDPTWESAVLYTVMIAPYGKMLYRKQGSVDILELRRTILEKFPSDYQTRHAGLFSGRAKVSTARSKQQKCNSTRNISRSNAALGVIAYIFGLFDASSSGFASARIWKGCVWEY